jgi:cell division protein FtsQ
VTRVVVTLLVMGALFVASWFVLPVENVTVQGNQHLPAALVARLAQANQGQPWLWIGASRAAALEAHPWVRSAIITRRFPNSVEIKLVERVPAATVINRDGSRIAVALDGTLLPNAVLPKVTIRGWGGNEVNNLKSALQILALLQSDQGSGNGSENGSEKVQAIRYTPQGFTILKGSDQKPGTIFTDSYASLLLHAGSVTMTASLRVNIHPWGVSLQ